jgi:hypothetical protein
VGVLVNVPTIEKMSLSMESQARVPHLHPDEAEFEAQAQKAVTIKLSH